MKTTTLAMLIPLAALACLPAARAADQASPTAAVANRDFTRLSTDGEKGYADVGLARLAIFDGRTDRAATLVDEAGRAFDRARGADTTFVKAEDRLHPPKEQPNPAVSGAKAPVAWIPVDLRYVLDETFARAPAAADAVGEANAEQKANRPDAAAETLRVASVGATDTVTILPLDPTLASIHRARALMASHDYYGASMALRDIDASARYDTVSVVGDPKQAAAPAATQATKSDATRAAIPG